MPSYCRNKISFKGGKDVIDCIEDAQFDFDKLYPPPDNLSHQEDIDWHNKYHGTWATSKCEIDRIADNSIVIEITTAWISPKQFIKYLMVKYPSLWCKMLSLVEGGHGELWIASMSDGQLNEKYLKWEEPNTDCNDEHWDNRIWWFY